MASSKKIYAPGSASIEAKDDEVLGGHLIKIAVWKSMVKFVVHLDALAHVSEYFANVFPNRNAEDIVTSCSMNLPDEHPKTFKRFVKCAYAKFDINGAIPPPVEHPEQQFGNLNREDLLLLYLLARRFEASTLQNELVTLFCDRLNRGIKRFAAIGVDEGFLRRLDWELDHNAACAQVPFPNVFCGTSSINFYHADSAYQQWLHEEVGPLSRFLVAERAKK